MRDEYKNIITVSNFASCNDRIFTICLVKNENLFLTRIFEEKGWHYKEFKTYKEAYEYIKKEYNRLENE